MWIYSWQAKSSFVGVPNTNEMETFLKVKIFLETVTIMPRFN